MATIPLKLDGAHLKKIDFLIKKGIFKNRSQAIRCLLADRLINVILPFENEANTDAIVNNVVKRMLGVSNQSLIINSDKSAVELVQEERERY